MKLLILGGGDAQLNAIKMAKKRGYTVIVSDYYVNAPGKKYSDYGELTSTFSVEGNIEVGRKYNIDGVMTTGTDQPVYTVARVADELDLPSPISVKTAKAVTNKREMKKLFTEHNIPTVTYRIIAPGFAESELADLHFPVVVKPLDSQGQRGVFKLYSPDEIRENIFEVLSFSREKEILVEEYYQSKEVTVSGWVQEGRLYILTVTDRITYTNHPHIGICTAHYFPSRFLNEYYAEIEEISWAIIEAFNIYNGPIYFQMLIGNRGIRVNEIACRVGGAYEDIFIPHLTGVDILGMVIDSSLGQKFNTELLQNYDLISNNKWFSVQLFFARPGKIEKMSDIDRVKEIPGMLKVKYNFNEGEIIGKIKNATERAGYFLVAGKDKKDLQEKISLVYDKLKIYDKKGKNLIIREIGEVLN